VNYEFEDFEEITDDLSLTQNNGGEIDIKQLTGKKEKVASSFMSGDKHSTQMMRGSLSAVKTMNKEFISSEPPRLQLR
jgi:hypothetical protein